MLRPLTCHPFVSCTLLLVVISSSGESWPHTDHDGRLDVDSRGNQRALLLEAVKTGILTSLGMGKEPTTNTKVSEEELRMMFQLYEEKLLEIRGNSSQMMRETSQHAMFSVLFPSTVESINLHNRGRIHSHQRRQWYRAVFHKNPSIQTELSLARAELKVSRQVLGRPTSVQPELRREVKVRVNRMKPLNSAARTHTDSPRAANVSNTDIILDISPEVKRWMKTGDNQALWVDVGIVVSGEDATGAKPVISLELELRARRRLPRSDEGDTCHEQGLCCRKSVTVSFRDIGWRDWIVAPSEYTIHYCDGACPHNYKPASMHTQVKSRLHQITKGGTPRPCCVPAAYEPMVLMHYDSQGKVKLTTFENFIVSECHCA
ncbi:inhibin beta C chain [Antennarius striatus]|uniref:inhibin beta C chain n=1 Tax=Antennarius striatus TaxID=241820 RepID=UPI0035B32991